MANKCKYYKRQELVSYDGGQTWSPTGVYFKGSLIEEYSSDCPYVPPTPVQYRWINLDPAVDYYCSGTTKYYKQQKQVSYDGGTTWEDVVPAEYQWGESAETQSTDCGYVPPTRLKFKSYYSDGRTFEAECDGNPTLTSATTKPSGYQFTAMTSAEIGDCVTSIGYAAFMESGNLTNIAIPDSVSTIGDYSFTYCGGLTGLTIPNSVTSIGNRAFFYCTSLTSITVNATTPPTLGDRYVFYNTNNCPIYVPCQSLEAYKTAWSDYESRIQCVEPFDGKFKATYSDSTTYSAACDSSTELTSATTKPSGYQYSAMTSAEIGNCVTSIGDYAFYYCTSLTNINIPNGVTSIGEKAIYYCSGITSITIPDSVTSIGIQVFHSCKSLTSVTIGSGVTSISNGLFYWCSSLPSITIPSSVTSIGRGAFERCTSLTSITIPDSVTSIGEYAFNDCSGLTSATIGTGVTSIDSYAFLQCSSLESITINAITPPALGRWEVFNDTNNCPIYVPAESVDAYKSSWSNYASRIQAIP